MTDERLQIERRELNGKLWMAVGILQSEMIQVKSELKSIDEKLSSFSELYIHKDVFKEVIEPIKKIVYGMVFLVLTGVGLSILTLIIKK
jgi:hypothetical protein